MVKDKKKKKKLPRKKKKSLKITKEKLHQINKNATRLKQKADGFFDGRFVARTIPDKKKYKRKKYKHGSED